MVQITDIYCEIYDTVHVFSKGVTISGLNTGSCHQLQALINENT